MFSAYLKTVRDKSDPTSFVKCVNENEKFLIRGTSYKEENVAPNWQRSVSKWVVKYVPSNIVFNL